MYFCKVYDKGELIMLHSAGTLNDILNFIRKADTHYQYDSWVISYLPRPKLEVANE